MSWHEVKTIVLRECRNDELRFNQRKLVPDTLAGPCAEREVDELRPGSGAFWREALGIECFRLRPECGESMQDVRDDEREPSTRSVETAQIIV